LIPTPRRLLFEAIAQTSELFHTGRFDSEEDLASDLLLCARAYGVSEIGTTTFDDEATTRTGYFSRVQDYYTGTEAQFSGVHSPDGSVHFGLSWDGEFRHDGFLEQARIVEQLVQTSGARSVLELGSGKGFNSIYLAGRNPKIEFQGVDLTPVHVRIATERGASLANLKFVEGNFHRLEHCEDRSIDLVFDVEAGCYSDTPEKLEMLFSELHRVLRPGGLFVQFGYFRSERFDELSPNAALSAKLVERAWVIEQFHRERAFNLAAEEAGFEPRERRDLREPSMPSVRRLYQQAKMFYRIMASPAKPLFLRMVRPSTHNAISAIALPYAYGLGALEYPLTVLSAR